MKSFSLLLLLSFTLATVTYAQSADCPCIGHFDFATEKIRINYAGYQDKVNANTKAAFDEHTRNLRKKAALATTEEECFKVLREWSSFFKDRHTGISLNYSSQITETDPDKLRALFAGTEKIQLTEKEAKAYFDKNKKKLDPVEGIYQSGSYRVAIIRSPKSNRDFACLILKADSVWWVPGQVKLELKKSPEGYDTKFYMKDHSPQPHKSTLQENQLVIGDLAIYQKLYPATTTTAKASSNPAKAANTFSLVELSPQTMLLTLPTFDHRYKPVIDSLLRVNEAKLMRTPNLIIDVRNNGGGSDISYSNIIPYLYTQPIVSISSAIWASADNIQKFQVILDDPSFPEDDKNEIRQLVATMQANPGTFIDRPNETTTLPKVYPNPAQVAILSGKGCGSSCEQFLLAAKASSKVKLYGENSGGVLDYANVHAIKMPCGNMNMYYATSRTKRLPHNPIDNIGIAPDVRLGTEVSDPVKHVQQLLERQPGN